MAAAVLAAPAIADAPGFFKIPGTETTMKISGKVEVDGVYTFTPSNGNTGSFSNDGEGTSSLPSWEDSGPDGQWDLSSIGRINVQTLTPTKYGDLLARVEIQGGGQNGATVKLRHAYVNMAV
jgi:hypothetical protein